MSRLEAAEDVSAWALYQPDFIGTAKQFTHCARCGELPPPKRHDEPLHFSATPVFHHICKRCYDELPD